MASSPSNSTWLWVIEALATFEQVDASILIDLVKRTPEISNDMGKDAREKVSLRILESFIAQRNGSSKGVCSATDSRIEFDPSENCEDVVRNILHEISASNVRVDGPEVLKWDFQAFIMHKRASLPKCALQQLKDAILEVSHPILASLKERGGLSSSNQSGNRIPGVENLVGLVRKDLADNGLLPSKRDRSDLDTENQAVRSREDRNRMDNGCVPHLPNAKKLKINATLTSQAVAEESVLIIGNELSKDVFGGNEQETVREGSDLAKIHLMGSLEQNHSSENGHDQTIASEQPGLKIQADDAGLQNNHPGSSCDNNIVPQDTFGDQTRQDLPVNEAKEGNNCVETGTSNVTLPNGISQNICGDGSLRNASNGAPLNGSNRNNFSNETKDDMQQHCGQEMSSDGDGYQDEKIAVALKKCSFLSSQCTVSEDSLETADCTELNLCMKCDKSGQLLVCSAGACPIVVHQSCLGSAPNFDNSGNFYCPFCAYSQAISECLEVKKKASVARKYLVAFIGLENIHQGNKLSKRFFRPKRYQLIHNDKGNYENEVNSSHNRENMEDKQQVEPSVSGVKDGLSCPEGAPTNEGPGGALMDGNREGEKMGPPRHSANEKGKEIEAQAGRNLGNYHSSCRGAEIIHMTNGPAENIIQQEVLQQPATDSTQQVACPPTIDAEESSEEENDKPVPNYHIRRRRQEKQYTYPTIPKLLRRKKVPWTCVEEGKLKEGVKRFSSAHDRNIPWKRILEFGSGVFHKGRTTVDLKDKWRNICKENPKSK